MNSSPPAAPLHRPRLRFLLLLALVGMVGLHAWVFFSLRREVRQGYPDFAAFYTGGQCVLRGLGSQLYSTQTQAAIQQEFASGVKIRNGPLPFTHPPFEAALFAPFALLSYPAAFWAWNVASLMALLGFLLALRPHVPRLRAWSEAVPLLAALAFFPVFACLLQGQDSLLLLLLFGLAFLAMRRDEQLLAGICLGAALFRFQLVLPVIAIMFLRRRWKVVGGFAAAAVVLAGISAAVAGWQQTLNYPRELLHFSQVQAGMAMNPKSMPNLRGVIASFAGDGAFAHALLALISVALVGVAAWKWKVDPQQPDFELGFGLAVTAALMVSYHMMTHDLSLLLIPLLLAAEWLLRERPRGMARRLTVAAIGLLFFSPLYFLVGFRYQRFSLMFWAVALLAAGLSLALGRAGAPALARAAGEKS